MRIGKGLQGSTITVADQASRHATTKLQATPAGAGQDGRMAPLRIGVLGAAKIAPSALIKPARRVDEVEVTAIAARDRAKAERFAGKHGIPVVHDSYPALIADPTIDAIYNPLPNGLHGRWTIAALEAGKHVLCEKPFTANADEAEAVAEVADRSRRVVMEAFHYRYHPFIDHIREIVRDELGTVRRVETWMIIPLPSRRDIRWQLDLAGGSTMDVGCYTIHLLRTLAGEEPEVIGASARERSPGIDRWLQADMRFATGATGKVTASMLSRRLLSLGARVEGDKGDLRVFNPYAPHLFTRLTVRSNGKRRTEPRPSREPTYLFQLRAFAAAALRGEPILTGPADSIANMRVIDAAYRAAGLEPRRPSR
jgi:predicted dehydrogenase